MLAGWLKRTADRRQSCPTPHTLRPSGGPLLAAGLRLFSQSSSDSIGVR